MNQLEEGGSKKNKGGQEALVKRGGGGGEQLNFTFLVHTHPKINHGVQNTCRKFQVQSPDSMYILAEIEEITFSLQNYIHIYTHMHLVGDVLNCVGRVWRDVSCSLKYFSSISCRSYHHHLILFAVEQPFIIYSIASLKRTSQCAS